MENASQALLIAGGILIAIITISLLVLALNNASSLSNANAQIEYEKRLAKQNAEWEAYNKALLYGTEVLTVFNKADENNRKYGDSSEDSVSVILLDQNNKKIANTQEFLEDKKTSVFKCTECEYNTSGKVSKMTFKYIE